MTRESGTIQPLRGARQRRRGFRCFKGLAVDEHPGIQLRRAPLQLRSKGIPSLDQLKQAGRQITDRCRPSQITRDQNGMSIDCSVFERCKFHGLRTHFACGLNRRIKGAGKAVVLLQAKALTVRPIGLFLGVHSALFCPWIQSGYVEIGFGYCAPRSRRKSLHHRVRRVEIAVHGE